MLAKDIVEYFKNFVEFVVEELGDDIKYWFTINEPGTMVNSYLFGYFPPEEKSFFKFYKVVFKNLVKMHRVGYDVIKNGDPDSQVSLAKNFSLNDPYNNRIWNVLAERLTELFLE